jgi:hypothetical protein
LGVRLKTHDRKKSTVTKPPEPVEEATVAAPVKKMMDNE